MLVTKITKGITSMQFTDADGRQWGVRVDWKAMKRSRLAGVDLSMVEEMLGDFYRGSDKFIDALWAVISPEAAALKIDRDEFEGAIRGDAMQAARDALLEAVIGFFPSDRALMIQEANDQVREQMAELLSGLRKSSTEQPENVELTPTGSL